MAVLDKHEVRGLYNQIAGRYDILLAAFRLTGLARHRQWLVERMNLKPGDTVIDLCCGTGENLALLAKSVGPSGRVIGVDLSREMLGKAQTKIRDAGWQNIELVEADVEHWQFPSRPDAVISTFGLEMVPAYDAIIEKAAASLAPNGRLGLLGLKHPEGWPDWLVEIGVWLTRPFGVSRDYKDFAPWKSAEKHLLALEYDQLLLSSAYRCVAMKAAPAASANSDE